MGFWISPSKSACPSEALIIRLSDAAMKLSSSMTSFTKRSGTSFTLRPAGSAVGVEKKSLLQRAKDVLANVDHLAGARRSRSFFIEQVLRQFLREHEAAHARELARINRSVAKLNAEAMDVLTYQSDNVRP